MDSVTADTANPLATVSDSTAGSWTQLVSTQSNHKTGFTAVWVRYLTSAPGPMTVTCRSQSTGSSKHLNFKVWVLTGAAATQNGATAAEDGSGTIAKGITTTVDGSIVYGACVDYDAATTLTANTQTTIVDQWVDTGPGDTWALIKSTNPVSPPGAVTLGVTQSDGHSIALAEILPAVGVSGSADFSGAGQLAASGSVGASAALSGGGALAADTSPAVSAQAALSGGGLLSASGTPGASVLLSGGGSLGAAGSPGVSAAADFSGEGSIGVTPTGVGATVSFSGAGTLTAGSGQTHYRIYGNQTPANAYVHDPSPVTLGTVFQSSQDGQITGVYYYKASPNYDGQTITVGLYIASNHNLLASAQRVQQASDPIGWVFVPFTTPVTINANTPYVAARHAEPNAAAGGDAYPCTPQGWATSKTSGPLTGLASSDSPIGNGVFDYDSTMAFPASTYNATDYFVDVDFVTQGGSGPTQASGRADFSGSGQLTTGGVIAHGWQINDTNTGYTAYFDQTLGRTLTQSDLTVSSLSYLSDVINTFGTNISKVHFTSFLVWDVPTPVTFTACLFDAGIRTFYSGNVGSATLNWCTVDAKATNAGYAVGTANITAYRCRFGGESDGIWIGGDSRYTECYVTCYGWSSADHNDGAQGYQGYGNVTIERCHITAGPVNGVGGANAAVFVADNTTGPYNLYDTLCDAVAGFEPAYSCRFYDGSWDVQGLWIVQGAYSVAPLSFFYGDGGDPGVSWRAWGDQRPNLLVVKNPDGTYSQVGVLSNGSPTASASLSGSGTLSAAAQLSSSNADFLGSGALAAAASPGLRAAADLSGVGLLSAAGIGSVAADFSGSGVLLVDAAPHVGAAVTFSGFGRLTAGFVFPAPIVGQADGEEWRFGVVEDVWGVGPPDAGWLVRFGDVVWRVGVVSVEDADAS